MPSDHGPSRLPLSFLTRTRVAQSVRAAGSRRSVQVLAAVLPLAIIAFLALQPRVFIPAFPHQVRCSFREHWWRVHLPFTVGVQAARKARLPRFRLGERFPDFKIFVISLKGATSRRESVQQQLSSRGIEFEWFDAVNGSEPLPLDLVQWYLRGSRLRAFQESQPGSREHKKQGSNLSNLRLMFKLIGDGAEMQLVLEDDFELLDENGDFLERLRALMAGLPEDWEFLWLHQGLRKAEMGPGRTSVQQRFDARANTTVGPNLRLTVENNWSLSMLYRRSFALKVIGYARAVGNKDIDDTLNDVCETSAAVCYTADPPLVAPSSHRFQSEIEEGEEGECPHGMC